MVRQMTRTKFSVLMVLGVGVASASCLAARTGDLDELRARALELVNQTRREQGLSPVQLGPEVNEAALAHARDMLKRDYYSHRSPEGNSVQDRYIAAGGSKWRLTAENIARCADCISVPNAQMVERLHRGWMESPEHRRNILRRGLTHFGFGIVSSREQGEYAVQVFAGPGMPRGLKTDEQTVPVPPSEQTSIALSKINDRRRAEGRSPVQANKTLIEVAQSVLPDPDAESFALENSINLQQHLPAEQRSADWRSISLLAAVCGGCGTTATEADARYFVEQWLKDAKYQGELLSPQVRDVGFLVGANGHGKKIGILVLGFASNR